MAVDEGKVEETCDAIGARIEANLARVVTRRDKIRKRITAKRTRLASRILTEADLDQEDPSDDENGRDRAARPRHCRDDS